MALINCTTKMSVNICRLTRRIRDKLLGAKEIKKKFITKADKVGLVKHEDQPCDMIRTRMIRCKFKQSSPNLVCHQSYSPWTIFPFDYAFPITNWLPKQCVRLLRGRNFRQFNLIKLAGRSGGRNGRRNNRNEIALCSAAALACTTGGDTEDNSKLEISPDEVSTAVAELANVMNPHNGTVSEDVAARGICGNDWTVEWESPSITIWSRPLPNKDFLQYKIHGRFDDIPAVAFFYIQTNITHRKEWDSTTDDIRCLRKFGNDGAEETELIYWRVNFPRMMAKRDYVFTRRLLVDAEKGVLAVVSRAVPDAETPVDSRFVRVTDFFSNMIVVPHQSFTENGFDYVMTYIDDTKTRMPAYGIKKLVRNVLPRFLENVHKESGALMAMYRDWHDAGADTHNFPHHRVKELHGIIELTELQISKPQEQQSEEPELQSAEVSQETAESLLPEEELIDVIPLLRVRLRKISPPSYLPDMKKYVQNIFSEGRFAPIPYKQVHAQPIRSLEDSSKSKMSYNRTYPNYGGGGYPSYRRHQGSSLASQIEATSVASGVTNDPNS